MATDDRAEIARMDTLQRLADAHPDLLSLNSDKCFVARKLMKRGKVALVSGGGSGHDPLHTGYVGEGMLDAACAGHYFSSPTPDQIAAAARHVEAGAGVLFIVKNYQGDLMNFALAAKLCPFVTDNVIVSDDVAAVDDNLGPGRGLAGTVVVEKVLGAAAEAGLDLPGLKRLGADVNARTHTFGVALSSCRIPGAPQPIYELAESEMEIGVGIHGERGRARAGAVDIGEIGAMLVERLERRALSPQEPMLMITNGLGSARDSELSELEAICLELLHKRGVRPVRSLTGSFATALDTRGFSLTLACLTSEMLAYWDAPVHTAALRWGQAALR